MGTGFTGSELLESRDDSSKVPEGAMLPYYKLLATCAPISFSDSWAAPLFSLNELLLKINGTNCVPQ